MAARFADYMVCLSDGKLLYQGETADVFTHEMLVDVFQIDAEITTDKRTGKPMMLSYDTM
jgi:iron complex transport system ATP-binding protein